MAIIGLGCLLETGLSAQSLQSFQRIDHMTQYVSENYSEFLKLCKNESVKQKLTTWHILASDEQNILLEQLFPAISAHQLVDLKDLAYDIKQMRKLARIAEKADRFSEQKYLHHAASQLQIFYNFAKKHRGSYNSLFDAAKAQKVDISVLKNNSKKSSIKSMKAQSKYKKQHRGTGKKVMAALGALWIGAMIVAAAVYTAVFTQS